MQKNKGMNFPSFIRNLTHVLFLFDAYFKILIVNLRANFKKVRFRQIFEMKNFEL